MTFENIFGILDVDFCVYYYALMVFGFVAVVASLLTLIGQALFAKKSDLKNNMYNLVYSGLFYFVSRLLYSMCVSSLKPNMAQPMM